MAALELKRKIAEEEAKRIEDQEALNSIGVLRKKGNHYEQSYISRNFFFLETPFKLISTFNTITFNTATIIILQKLVELFNDKNLNKISA